MEPLLVAVLGAVAIAAVALGAVARRRGDRLRELRDVLSVARDREAAPAMRATITSARDAEDRAQRASLDLAQVLDLLGVGVIEFDAGLAVRQANRAAHLLLGSNPAGLVGRTAIEALGDHRLEELARAALAGGAASGEVTLREGAEPTVLVRVAHAASGGIWMILEDVSELRRLQRIRAEFIDNLSHELRTPLTTVRLLTETLARDLERTEPPPRLRDRIQMIDIETGHLVQMVNELLDLSRIEQGTAPLHLAPVDLAPLLRASLERLRLFAERQGVRLTTEIPDDLPRVLIDEERVGQLLVNLLHNAVKFSPGGGDVVVRARPAGQEVVVSVQDHGIGIPRDDLDRIFERFYKVDRARPREGGGTGLGLSIARHVFQGHGGRIWAESEEGSGSTFSFTLPVVTGRQAAEDVGAASA